MSNRSRSRKIKESRSRFYLDFAEKLPEFHGTAIAMLQTIRPVSTILCSEFMKVDRLCF